MSSITQINVGGIDYALQDERVDKLTLEKSRTWQTMDPPAFANNMSPQLGDTCMYHDGEKYVEKRVVANIDVSLIPSTQEPSTPTDVATFGTVGKYKITISRFTESKLVNNWNGGSWALTKASGVGANGAQVYLPLVLTGYNATTGVVYTNRPETDKDDFTQIYATQLVETDVEEIFVFEAATDMYGNATTNATYEQLVEQFTMGKRLLCRLTYTGPIYENRDSVYELWACTYNSLSGEFFFSGVANNSGLNTTYRVSMLLNYYNMPVVTLEPFDRALDIRVTVSSSKVTFSKSYDTIKAALDQGQRVDVSIEYTGTAMGGGTLPIIRGAQLQSINTVDNSITFCAIAMSAYEPYVFEVTLKRDSTGVARLFKLSNTQVQL